VVRLLVELSLSMPPGAGVSSSTSPQWLHVEHFSDFWSISGFYINLPIGAIVGIILLGLNVPEIKAKPPVREVFHKAVSNMDLLGLFLLWPTAIMFFLALQWGGTKYAWDSSTVIGLFVGAAATFSVFLWWEHRCGDNALLPFSMLRMRVIYSASATMFFFMGAMLTAYYYLPIYFQAVKGDSPLMSGVHILPSIISQVIVTMSTGTLSKFVSVHLFPHIRSRFHLQ